MTLVKFSGMLLLFSPCFRACRCWLYGAVLEKSKGAAAGAPAKGSIKGALVPTPRAQVVRVPTSAGRLTKLLERFRWYKYDIMQMLLKVCVGPHRGLLTAFPGNQRKPGKIGLLFTVGGKSRNFKKNASNLFSAIASKILSNCKYV